jgi:hypothetical protein
MTFMGGAKEKAADQRPSGLKTCCWGSSFDGIPAGRFVMQLSSCFATIGEGRA